MHRVMCLAAVSVFLAAGCSTSGRPSIRQAYGSVQPGRELPGDIRYPDNATVARTGQSPSARTSAEWKFGRHIERAAALMDERGVVSAKHYVLVREEAFLFLGWQSMHYIGEWEMVVPPGTASTGVESICKQFAAADAEDLLPHEVDFAEALRGSSDRLAGNEDFHVSGTAETSIVFPFAASTTWRLSRQGDLLRLSMDRTGNWYAIIHWPAALVVVPTMNF